MPLRGLAAPWAPPTPSRPRSQPPLPQRQHPATSRSRWVSFRRCEQAIQREESPVIASRFGLVRPIHPLPDSGAAVCLFLAPCG